MKIEPLKLKQIVLGEGRPKICVPLTGRTKEELCTQAEVAAGTNADLVEWRVDYYEAWQDNEQVLAVLADIVRNVAGKPLIFTFRTAGEGGEASISRLEYLSLNLIVAESGLTDLIDVELYFHEDVPALVEAIHLAGGKVILSNHEFYSTPPEEELIARLCRMQEIGGDVLKIAVMPQEPLDVTTLLSATARMYRDYASKPIVTMSMSGLGTVSRIAGSVFGSAMTFGTAGQTSAPGQVEIGRLEQALDLLQVE